MLTVFGGLVSHDRAVADSVVANFLVFVGLPQKFEQLLFNARRVFQQPRKFGADAGMRLCDFAGVFDDEGFGRMKCGIVRRARRDPGKGNGGDDFSGVVEIVARSGEIIFSFRLHRSRPSRRSSCISPVRSR